MNKKNTLVISLVFLLIALTFIFFNIMNTEVSENESFIDRVNIDLNEELILFYGEGCEYCSLVNSFIEDNKLESSTHLQVKEIYLNQINADEFEGKFNQCNPQPPFRGVPLLWHGSFCLMGEQEIIDYLDQLFK
jgi:hypothetical protein